MGVSANRFNDPALGQAFANLSSMFAPPSGSDLAGYATAGAKKAEAARLAELFNYAKSPEFQQQMFDRLGQATGQWTPSTGYYGVDTTAATSRSNNAADNLRALEQTRLGNQKDITVKMLDPVVKDATRFIPQSVADMYGTGPTQVGVISANPGETIYTPDGRTINGAPKPLSETEVKGAILQSLTPEEQRAIGLKEGTIELGQGQVGFRPDGTQIVGPEKPLSVDEVNARERDRLIKEKQITDPMLIDTIMGAEAPVQTVGADGKPRFMNPGEAVRTGAQPFVKEGSEAKPTNGTALLPDGQTRVPTVQGKDGRWYYAQQPDTPLPEGSQVFDMSKAVGTMDEIGMGTTANQTQANKIRAGVANGDALVREIDTVIRDNPAASGLAADILSFGQDLKQVFAEFGAKFGNDPDMPVTPEQLESLLPAGDYNPTYRRVRAMLLELAYSNASMNNPSGEVSRQALEREIEALGSGWVGNDESVLASLDVARQRLRRKLMEADVLDGRAKPPTADTLYTPDAGTKTPAKRMRFDENGDPIQ